MMHDSLQFIEMYLLLKNKASIFVIYYVCRTYISGSSFKHTGHLFFTGNSVRSSDLRCQGKSKTLYVQSAMNSWKWKKKKPERKRNMTTCMLICGKKTDRRRSFSLNNAILCIFISNKYYFRRIFLQWYLYSETLYSLQEKDNAITLGLNEATLI